ncbi:M20/M25/M40 family metallo-hydrolase [Anabaena sp. UHCC 0204]|uniref:M20/M25/M40 family metallo-hydrolase n=1 Tax=Anabaena sp. UHCC 0204 TaxID=2590009 RepID=UPI00144886BD|nr:M20/M25/M40 family metallo-hydrolase [Anabaena sp. UHCC 0204]MTJ09963.1 M20/M25/M40 family metallo-hydrolase [Anabaena sp. UHCC 0204]
MQKKWLWVLVGIIVFLSIGGFLQQPEIVPIVKKIPVPQSQPQLETRNVNNTLLVNGDQLFAHVQKLNFRRYSKRERSLTRTYITNELRKFGWQPKLEKFPNGVNIFTQKLGTDKTAGAILVAAHYDTVPDSPGADDNATGIAVVLEIARLFSSVPTPKTLQLAFFDQEETGLLGSKAFVNQPTHLENLQGVIIMDMLGYACYIPGCQQYPAGLPVTPPSDKGDFLAVVGDLENLQLLNAFQNSSENLPKILKVPIPFKGLLTPDTLRSDHAPFWYQGIGAVLVTDTANLRSPHYHQPSDIPENIQRDFFTGSSQIIVNATSSLLAEKSVKKSPPAS